MDRHEQVQKPLTRATASDVVAMLLRLRKKKVGVRWKLELRRFAIMRMLEKRANCEAGQTKRHTRTQKVRQGESRVPILAVDAYSL